MTHSPISDVERMSIDNGKELSGRQEAALRMLPADERFSTFDGAGGHVHFGLVVEEELLACESCSDSLKIFVMAASGERETRIEEVVAVLAADLGLIESLRGLAQKLVGIDILGLWIAGDAGAGGKLERQIAERRRAARRLREAV